MVGDAPGLLLKAAGGLGLESGLLPAGPSCKPGGLGGMERGVGVPGLTQVLALRVLLAVIIQSRGTAICAVIPFQAQSFSEAGHLPGGPKPPICPQTPPNTTGYPYLTPSSPPTALYLHQPL